MNSMARSLFFLASSLFLATIGLPELCAIEPIAQASVKESRKAVVVVQGVKGEAKSEGIGVVVSQHGEIVVDSSVVDGKETIEVVFKSGEKVSAKTIFVDAKLGIAIVHFATDKAIVAIQMDAGDKLETGDSVVTFGLPPITAIVGVFEGFKHPEDKPVGLIQVSSSSSTGITSGPVVDKNGKLVGMIVSMGKDRQSVRYAIPSSVIGKVLSDLRKCP